MVRVWIGATSAAVGLLVCALFTGLLWLMEYTPPPFDGIILTILVLPRVAFWPASLIYLILVDSPNWGLLFWQVTAIATGLNVLMYFLLGVLFGPRVVDRWGVRKTPHLS